MKKQNTEPFDKDGLDGLASSDEDSDRSYSIQNVRNVTNITRIYDKDGRKLKMKPNRDNPYNMKIVPDPIKKKVRSKMSTKLG